MKLKHRLVPVLVATLLLAILLPSAVAQATTDVGYQGFSYDDENNVQIPTADKPQSKLWFQDGSWWGLLYNTSANATNIYRLDLTTQTWVDTGTTVDNRPSGRGDALWDGQKLYVVSGTTVVSEWGSPPTQADVTAGSAQLSRFSYDPATRTYSLDAGFPVTVYQGSSESITLAKDSKAKLWVTFTKVAADNSNQVYVNRSLGSDTQWGTPFVLPVTNAQVHYDDVSAIVAFQGNKIGVMWSNQNNKRFYFAVHQDGAGDQVWQPTQVAFGGGVGGCTGGCSNDHLNLKQLNSDDSGRVYAAVKTANRNTGQVFVSLAVRDAKGKWSGYNFSSVEDLHTRPMVMIDEENRQLFMFAVAPEEGGTIYYKQTPLDNISFEPGMGTPFLQSSVDTDISNATSTKQNLNSQTGLVVLASANSNGRYWHNFMSLTNQPKPVPAAPTRLVVSSDCSNTSSVQLSWSDNSNNEDGFKIERKTGTASFSQVATVGSNVTSYTDTGLTSGTTYTYRVRAWNAMGDSTYSYETSGTTAGSMRTFTSVADTYVDSSLPQNNYGSATSLEVDSSPVEESYLKFELSCVSSARVTSAKLRLYVTNGSVKGGSVAKMNNTTWDEDSVNYNTRPVIDGAVLSNLGAVSVGQWIEFDVTAAVTTDGLLSLGLKTSSTDGAHYASREDSPNSPQLVITVAQ